MAVLNSTPIVSAHLMDRTDLRLGSTLRAKERESFWSKLRCGSCNGDWGASSAAAATTNVAEEHYDSDTNNNSSEKDEKLFVKIMREAQPYFEAHRGSTFVLVFSADIVDSPFLPSILDVGT